MAKVRLPIDWPMVGLAYGIALVASSSPPYPQTPVIESNNAILCLVINLVFPGIGTIVSGVMGNKPLIGRGIAQLLLAFIFVTWIWALVTTIQLLSNAKWQARPATSTA